MDNPKISVLIPLYNRKHYITQCVDSALNQTFQEDYEIIIRDDCSTDGSFEFVQEKYAKEISTGKIRLYKNEENLGEWGTTNALLNNAKGKYIGVLHSDDLYLSHALKHLYEIAEKTNADVVHESFFLILHRPELLMTLTIASQLVGKIILSIKFQLCRMMLRLDLMSGLMKVLL